MWHVLFSARRNVCEEVQAVCTAASEDASRLEMNRNSYHGTFVIRMREEIISRRGRIFETGRVFSATVPYVTARSPRRDLILPQGSVTSTALPSVLYLVLARVKVSGGPRRNFLQYNRDHSFMICSFFTDAALQNAKLTTRRREPSIATSLSVDRFDQHYGNFWD